MQQSEARESTKERGYIDLIWPELNALPEITHAIALGRRVCIALAILTFLLPGSLWPLATIVLFIVLGFGIGRKSRLCAVVAFAIYVVGRVVTFASLAGGPFGLYIVFGAVITIWFCVLLVNAMRATFAYQTHQKRIASTLRSPELNAEENIAKAP